MPIPPLGRRRHIASERRPWIGRLCDDEVDDSFRVHWGRGGCGRGGADVAPGLLSSSSVECAKKGLVLGGLGEKLP